MNYAGTNYVAIFGAAVAAWLFGAAWYGILGRQWMKAAKLNPTDMKMSAVPFIIGFVCELVMAFVLAGHLGPGQVTLWNGLVSAAILWAGFVGTTLTVNHRYQNFGWDLTFIDGGHWLGVALIMGAIIGWFGA